MNITIRKAEEKDSEKLWHLMKELFVDANYRGQHIGEKLMNALRKEAEINNCKQIKWTVAPWNEQGKKVYEKLGANENKDWLYYEWNI